MAEREGPLVARAPRGPSHACQAPVPGRPLPGGLGCSAMKSVGPAASIAGFELQLFRHHRTLKKLPHLFTPHFPPLENKTTSVNPGDILQSGAFRIGNGSRNTILIAPGMPLST